MADRWCWKPNISTSGYPAAAITFGGGRRSSPRSGSGFAVVTNRSANAGAENQSTYSDPTAREQSRGGHHPFDCGLIGTLFAIGDAVQVLIDTAQTVSQELHEDSLRQMQTCRGIECSFITPESKTLNRIKRAAWEFAKENPDVVISLIPVVGDVFDLAVGIAGIDIKSGRQLSNLERGFMVGVGLVGLFTVGDELAGALRLAGRVMDKGEGLKAVMKTGRGLRGLDNLAVTRQLADVSRFRNLDDVVGAARVSNRLQNLDNFTDGSRAVSRGGDVRRSFGSDSGALSRRLDTQQRLRNVTADSNRAASSASDVRRSFGSDNGALSRRLDNGPSVRRNCNSFTAETLVHTDEGQKPIEDIEVGDKVLGEDPESGEQGYFEVVAVRSHPKTDILEVRLDSGDAGGNNEEGQLNSGETMEVTPEHPIYVEGKGWIWAENLAVGDRLRRADGGTAKVLAIERIELATPAVVYNFTVKGPHTYFVLDVGVLVHNCGSFDDVKQALDIDGLVPANRVNDLINHPPIADAVKTKDFSTLRKLLGIPDNGITNSVTTKLTDLWNLRTYTKNRFKGATLEAKDGIAVGRWAPGPGPKPTVGQGAFQSHLGDELIPLEAGNYMYIIDTSNNIRYVPIPKDGPDRLIVHSQLAGGQRVLGAGEFTVNAKGVIKRVDTSSGHFKPSPEYLAYAKAVFDQKGLVEEGTTRFIASFDPLPRQTPLEEVMTLTQMARSRATEKVKSLWRRFR